MTNYEYSTMTDGVTQFTGSGVWDAPIAEMIAKWEGIGANITRLGKTAYARRQNGDGTTIVVKMRPAAKAA